MKRIWSMSELAAEVGCSRATMWSRVHTGTIPSPAYRNGKGFPYWSESQAQRIIVSWVDDLRRNNGSDLTPSHNG